MKLKKFCMGVDYNDLVLSEYKKNGELFGEPKIRALLTKLKRAHINTIYWRVSYIGFVIPDSGVCTNAIDILEKYDHSQIPEHVMLSCKALVEIYRQCNPLDVAIDQCKWLGMKLFAYITCYDDAYLGLEQQFGKSHPEYYSRHYSGQGYVKGVLSYGYPQTREYRLRQIEELLRYDVDGIYMDIARTHAGGNPIPVHGWYPQWTQPYLAYGYNDFEVEEYKTLYGDDPPIYGLKSSAGIEETGNTLNWNRVRGSFVDILIREASQVVHAAGRELSVGFYPTTYNGFQPGYQTRQMVGRILFDWQRWVDNGWIDEIHLIADHRRFGYDDWIKHSERQYKSAQDKGISVLVSGCVSGSIDQLDDCPYPLPVKDRAQYLTLQARYVWKMLNSAADGIYFYEAIEQIDDLYRVLEDTYEKYLKNGADA